MIWRCHLGVVSDECVPLSATKFGWPVKVESIQEVEVGRR